VRVHDHVVEAAAHLHVRVVPESRGQFHEVFGSDLI
jgi:hypothetical protein